MQLPSINMTPALAIVIGAVTMFVGVGSSLIISSRVDDGDVVILSDPSAFEIVVEIRGAVRDPGIYHLPEDARFADLLAAAGGATEDADLVAHNLARRLKDGEAVTVERVGAATPVGADGPSDAGPLSVARKINVNTASKAELETLPGIGPTIAQRIIDDRMANGPYQDIGELTRVQGISENMVAELRALITVGP